MESFVIWLLAAVYVIALASWITVEPKRALSAMVLGPACAALAGAVCGFLAEWPAALLAMRLTEAGSPDGPPHWDTSYATFSALFYGSYVGVWFGVAGYLAFFVRFPLRRVLKSIPLLYLAVLLGALTGIWLGPLRLIAVACTFLVGCVLVARGLRALPPVARPS